MAAPDKTYGSGGLPGLAAVRVRSFLMEGGEMDRDLISMYRGVLGSHTVVMQLMCRHICRVLHNLRDWSFSNIWGGGAGTFLTTTYFNDDPPPQCTKKNWDDPPPYCYLILLMTPPPPNHFLILYYN